MSPSLWVCGSKLLEVRASHRLLCAGRSQFLPPDSWPKRERANRAASSTQVRIADGSLDHVRVRTSALGTAVNEVASLGTVRSKSFKGEDVTEQYVDGELRLENARKARDRYLELMKQAENVQAALAVEKELERLNGEIELLEGRANKLKHLTDMATISVDLNKREKLGPLGYACVGAWKGVRWLFVRG